MESVNDVCFPQTSFDQLWLMQWTEIPCFHSFIEYSLVLVISWGIADGLKYYDLEEGKGPVAEKGSTVQVFL